MNARWAERLLWLLAVAVLAVGWGRWRDAEPGAAGLSASVLALTPTETERVPPETLAEAARAVAAGNPFRLDRAPAPIGFARPGGPGGPGFGPGMMPDFPSYAPPSPPRPPLSVSGIVGPPWRAVIEGIPGREGGVVVQRGDELGELRIRDVTATTVVVAAPDTTWRLTLRRPWQ